MIYLAIFSTGVIVGAVVTCITLLLWPDYREDLPTNYGPEHDFGFDRERVDVDKRSLRPLSDLRSDYTGKRSERS